MPLRLGDIMGAAQWRHIKLWFAGKLLNWDLAAYELSQIKGSLVDAATLYPGIHDSDHWRSSGRDSHPEDMGIAAVGVSGPSDGPCPVGDRLDRSGVAAGSHKAQITQTSALALKRRQHPPWTYADAVSRRGVQILPGQGLRQIAPATATEISP
jgi:hypothetical protein